MKKIIVLFIAFFCFTNMKAQVAKISIQASGLTCSMCSNAINKSLKTLDFVDKIDANIKTSTFNISFKQGSRVDFDKLKAKVEDAGFFVANFIVTLHFDNVSLQNDNHTTIDDITFHFLNIKDQLLSGEKTIRIIDKGYVSAKEYRRNSKFTLMECYKTGVAGACCAKDGLVKGTRVFHATI